MSETILKTPAEVAAFLAGHVMGWRRVEFSGGDSAWLSGSEVTRHDWDPWRDVRDALRALEAWTASMASRSGGLICQPDGSWEGDADGGFERPGEHGDGYSSRPSRALCMALCQALGAEVQIEEDAP